MRMGSMYVCRDGVPEEKFHRLATMNLSTAGPPQLGMSVLWWMSGVTIHYFFIIKHLNYKLKHRQNEHVNRGL